MTRNHKIAIYVYRQTMRTVAHFGGGDFRPATKLALPTDIDIKDLLAKAGQLAQPSGAGPNPLATSQPLQSIMGHLHNGEHKGYYLPQCISTNAAMPKTDPPSEKEIEDAYRTVWRDMQNEYNELQIESQPFEVQEANLYALLQRYAWAIPAPVTGVNDVSYFDYARVRAALAVCMDPQQQRAGQAPAHLVGADLSGIQDWLYTVSSRGAAKSLRGRSIYLQLLMEVIALDLLQRLGLPAANLLYVGGGKFYMLVPNHAQADILSYQKEVSDRLLNMHQGDLYMAIAATPLSQSSLETNQAGQAWREINLLLDKQKLRRFAELDSQRMASTIGKPLPLTSFKPADRCVVCRRPIADHEETEELENSNNPDEKIGSFCLSVRNLGRRLSQANYLVLSRVDRQDYKGKNTIATWQEGLRTFGFQVAFPTELSEKKLPRQRTAWVYTWELEQNMVSIFELQNKQNIIASYRPLAQCVPLDEEGNTATFDQLDTEGIRRWGALRMDVDKLGNIFQSGIAPASLSRAVGLSSLMRLFFEGHVPTLAAKYHEPREGKSSSTARIHLMYAGGDDLFLVGGWSWLPHLANDIRQAFAAFACQNPAVTISGGISLALSEHYPLYQAAKDAGEAEDKSKDGGRNAITFLDETLPWEPKAKEIQAATETHGDEEKERVKTCYESYTHVSQRVAEMNGWLQSGGGLLPRSFIMNLREIDAEWREWKRLEQEREQSEDANVQPRYNHHTNRHLYLGPWQWHQVYSLKRAGERTRNSDYQESLQELSRQLIEGEIFSIGISARWLELLSRKSQAQA